MMINPLLIVLVATGIAATVYAAGGWRSLTRMKLLRAGRSFLIALVMLLTALCSALFLVAHHGYRSCTREERAATVYVDKVGTQDFTVKVIRADSTEEEFSCKGDQLYIDAHILKWHPFLNVIGLHTTYELDRIGGRYISIDDEKNSPRTVYTLASDKMFNLFDIRKKWQFLHPLLDAGYGSATFVEMSDGRAFDVMVSTSGLLVRKSKL